MFFHGRNKMSGWIAKESSEIFIPVSNVKVNDFQKLKVVVKVCNQDVKL